MRHLLLGLSVLLGTSLLAPSTSIAADLETIRARGHLVVAVKDNWQPLGFTDSDGNLVGFEIDLARNLARSLFGDETAVVFRPVSNTERLPAVLEEQVDIAISGVSVTPMRQRIVSFSTPYYLDGTAFITNNPAIQTLENLETGAIALLEGSDAVSSVNYRLPSAVLIGVPSYQAALNEIRMRRVDAIAADVSVLAGWLQTYPGYRLLPSLLTAEPLAVVIPKGNRHRSLREFVNTSINQWHEDGWLESQATRWGLP